MEVEGVVRPDQGDDGLEVVVGTALLDGIVVDDCGLALAFFDVILLTPKGTARHGKICMTLGRCRQTADTDY